MDDFSDLLASEAVVAGMGASGKKALFQQLGTIAANIVDVDPALVIDRLTEREKLGSTGFGGGVAIPHGKIDGLERVVGIFVRLWKRDGKPRYLDMIPRVWALMERDLMHPALEPVAA